ncbi:MAG: stalk domain-containing protein [Clostridia bacterium]|nr:stalk domain-containing protein [Clostridia bacterium]
MYNDRKILALLLTCALTLCCPDVMCEADETLTYYVSPSGNDNNRGTIESPFKSLDRAKLAARDNKECAVDIVMKGGTYYLNNSIVFNADDTRSDDAPLKVSAADGENVRFIGGKSIDASKFTKVIDGEILSRLPVSVRGKVYSVNLDELGEYNLGYMKQYGTYYGNGTQIPDIYVNGRKMNCARWPNENYTKVGTVLNMGSVDTKAGQKPANMVGATIKYSDDRIARWANAEDGWLFGYWTYNWDSSSLKIKNIDIENKTITTEDSSTFGVSEGQRYYAFNMIEELDSPGEWYIDRNTHILYYYPNCDLENTDMIISQIDRMFDINSCKNITFKGLSIESSKEFNVFIGENAENIVFRGCSIKGGIIPVYINGKNNGIINCDVYDAGFDCCQIYGGIADNNDFELCNNFVINCDIHDFGQRILSGCGIRMGGQGAIAQHNRIHDGPAWGIGCGGFLQKIQYNEIYDVVLESSDSGAIYCGRDSRHRGMDISYNYIHDVYGTYGVNDAFFIGVYLDDYEAGIKVTNNVFKNVSTPVYGHHSAQCIVENNLSINKTASTNGSIWWTSGDWYQNIDLPSTTQGTFWSRHASIDWTKEPYSSLFPEAKNMTKDNALDPFGNSIKNNVFVNHSELNIASNVYLKSTVENNYFYESDPGFVDANNDNYSLREDSVVFKDLPEFENPDMSQMGLIYDPERPSEFTEVGKKDMFKLFIPEDGQKNVMSYNAEFAWDISEEPGIEKYLLQIAKDKDFNDISFDLEVGDTSKKIQELEPNTTYYWRVAAIKENGKTKELLWNPDGVRSFQTSYYVKEIKNDASKEVKLNDILSDKENWNVGSAKKLESLNNGVKITADLGVGGYDKVCTRLNEMYHFSATFDGGAWYAFGILADNTSEFGWVRNSHYLIIVKPDALELHKYPNSFTNSGMIKSVPAEISFDDGKVHDIVFGTNVVDDMTYIVFAMDGEVIFKIKDEQAGSMYEEGKLCFYVIGDNGNASLTISEPIKDMPDVSIKKTNLPEDYTKALSGGVAMKTGSPRVYKDLIETQIDNANSDITPININDRTFGPVRFISETVGAEVAWNDSERKVTITKGEDIIVMQIGNEICTLNGEKRKLDYGPVIINDITYLPLRFIAEMLGLEVEYNEETGVILTVPGENKLYIEDKSSEWWNNLSKYIDFGNDGKKTFKVMAA